MNKLALIKKCVSKLNPIDDLMFRKMVEEREFCEEMLRTILGDPQLIWPFSWKKMPMTGKDFLKHQKARNDIKKEKEK